MLKQSTSTLESIDATRTAHSTPPSQARPTHLHPGRGRSPLLQRSDAKAYGRTIASCLECANLHPTALSTCAQHRRTSVCIEATVVWSGPVPKKSQRFLIELSNVIAILADFLLRAYHETPSARQAPNLWRQWTTSAKQAASMSRSPPPTPPIAPPRGDGCKR